MELANDEVLVLRTCKSDMTSYNNFQWPELGYVEAPDWYAGLECGFGLHGFLWGEGDGFLANWNDNAKWLVVKVNKKDLVKLNGKVKFKKGEVIYSGNRKEATNLIFKYNSQAIIIGAILKGKDIHVGYEGMATVGDKGTAIAGYRGTAKAGYYGTAIAGDYGTATSKGNGKAIVGDRGTATTKDHGKAIAGIYGKVIAGIYGMAIVGSEGTAIVGNYGIATAGYKGKAKAGSTGRIEIEYYTGNRLRKKIGYIGEDGLKPNVFYRLNRKHEFEEVK